MSTDVRAMDDAHDAHQAAGAVLTSSLFISMITSFQSGLVKDLYDLVRQCNPHWDMKMPIQRRQCVRLLGIDVIRRGDLRLLQLAAQAQFYEPVGQQLVMRRIALHVHYAIENHRADMLRWIYIHGYDPLACTANVWNDAIVHFNGDYAILEELQRLGVASPETCIQIVPATAYRFLDLRLLRWVHENVPNVTLPLARIMTEAVDAGKLDVVRYLHETYPTHIYRSSIYTRAWASGALDVLEFLLKHRSEPCTDRFLEQVVATGSEHVVAMVYRLRGHTTQPLRPHDVSTNTKNRSLVL